MDITPFLPWQPRLPEPSHGQLVVVAVKQQQGKIAYFFGQFEKPVNEPWVVVGLSINSSGILHPPRILYRDVEAWMIVPEFTGQNR